MNTELKIAIWQIANAAIEMNDDKLNSNEFEELAINALRQVKNLYIPVVSGSALCLCEKCGGFVFTVDGKQCVNCGHYR